MSPQSSVMSSKDKVKIDILIIGSGITGLMTAYKLSLIKKFQNLDIVIIDKAPYVGEHTSGRNSGVLHSGLYYEHNSLKHLLCIEGIKQWDQISKELNIPTRICGKYIIANGDQQENELLDLKRRAMANGLDQIRKATTAEIQRLDSIAYCSDAIYSPDTGIIDNSQALVNIKSYLYNRNIPILYSTEAQNISTRSEHFIVETSNEIIESNVLINTAGLDAVSIRKKLGLKELQDKYIKGNYLKYSKSLPIKSLVYPTPSPNLKGLGVHLTIDFQNQYKFGPDTQDIDKIDYSMESQYKQKLSNSINKIFKHIDIKDLHLDYAGIRPKILKDGSLYKDFWIKKPLDNKNYIEAAGIESPGFTAAPAIADKITALIL